MSGLSKCVELARRLSRWRLRTGRRCRCRSAASSGCFRAASQRHDRPPAPAPAAPPAEKAGSNSPLISRALSSSSALCRPSPVARRVRSRLLSGASRAPSLPSLPRRAPGSSGRKSHGMIGLHGQQRPAPTAAGTTFPADVLRGSTDTPPSAP